MDRPSRKSKVVNYCEAKDFDDDEDFASVRPPPTKKAKEDVRQQENKQRLSKTLSQEFNSQGRTSDNGRKPLDERLHERDLEAAITLSLLNSSDSAGDQSQATKGVGKTGLSSCPVSNCIVDSSLLGLDKITAETNTRKPCPVGTKRSKDEDEDYQPKMTPDSESDVNLSEQADSEDEEFVVKKTTKTSKAEKRTKSEKQTAKLTAVSKKEKQTPKQSKSNPRQGAAVKVTKSPTTRVASEPKKTGTSSPPCRPVISLSPAGGRVPKWTPPGQIGKGATSPQTPALKSPAQGLRLGLSRRVRVKPLHPSISNH